MKRLPSMHVKFLIDSATAVATINNMGSCNSRDCHAIVCQIWEFCIQPSVWISAAHIPGIDNVAADRESRQFKRHDTKWQLDPKLLNEALPSLDFPPNINIFASQ